MDLQLVVSHFLKMDSEQRDLVLTVEREVANNSEKEYKFATEQVNSYSRVLRTCFKEDRNEIRAILNGWKNRAEKATGRYNQSMDRIDAFLNILIKESKEG